MVLIVPILLGLVGIVFVLAWSIGLGWLLTLLLPFNLFEGSILAMAASVIVASVASRILKTTDFPFNEPEEEDDDSFDLTTYTIPATRFYTSQAEQTWEAWVRFELANRIDNALLHSPRVTGRMDKNQRQELAIRLTDVAIGLLKAKTGRSKLIRTRLKDWQQQMIKQDLKPYDEAILRLAMVTLHRAVAHPMVDNVVRSKMWDKPAAIFDLVSNPLEK